MRITGTVKVGRVKIIEIKRGKVKVEIEEYGDRPRTRVETLRQDETVTFEQDIDFDTGRS
jgi:hypothetical protein